MSILVSVLSKEINIELQTWDVALSTNLSTFGYLIAK